jgi:hypothetical protein
MDTSKRRLVLSRETVRELTREEMTAVGGGAKSLICQSDNPINPCPTYQLSCLCKPWE